MHSSSGAQRANTRIVDRNGSVEGGGALGEGRGQINLRKRRMTPGERSVSLILPADRLDGEHLNRLRSRLHGREA
jgi:hypothetical protein